MMMSKPKEGSGGDAVASTTTTTSSETKLKPPTPLDAVADLERRLQELSSATPHIPSVTSVPAAVAPPAVVAAAAPAPTVATTATSSKNALLVRTLHVTKLAIMLHVRMNYSFFSTRWYSMHSVISFGFVHGDFCIFSGGSIGSHHGGTRTSQATAIQRGGSDRPGYRGRTITSDTTCHGLSFHGQQ
jgi:hypothetical protein